MNGNSHAEFLARPFKFSFCKMLSGRYLAPFQTSPHLPSEIHANSFLNLDGYHALLVTCKQCVIDPEDTYLICDDYEDIMAVVSGTR